jgi:hypothetical protein
MGKVGERRETTKGRATPAGIGLREEYGNPVAQLRGGVSRGGGFSTTAYLSGKVAPSGLCRCVQDRAGGICGPIILEKSGTTAECHGPRCGVCDH